MNIKNQVKVELYKVAHSGLVWIHIFVPLLVAGVFLVYYSFCAWSGPGKVVGYLQVLSMGYPVMIGLIMTIVSDIEMRAGHCQLMLTAPCRRSTVHLVKLSVLLACGLLSSLLAVLGFGVVFRLTGDSVFSIAFFARSALLLFGGNSTLYMLGYLVSFQFSGAKGVGIGIGIVGSLISGLLQTSLGDAVWYYVPYAIALRWCSLYAMGQVGDRTLTPCTDVAKSVIFMVISGLFLFVFLIFWGNVWEAKAAGEE